MRDRIAQANGLGHLFRSGSKPQQGGIPYLGPLGLNQFLVMITQGDASLALGYLISPLRGFDFSPIQTRPFRAWLKPDAPSGLRARHFIGTRSASPCYTGTAQSKVVMKLPETSLKPVGLHFDEVG